MNQALITIVPVALVWAKDGESYMRFFPWSYGSVVVDTVHGGSYVISLARAWSHACERHCFYHSPYVSSLDRHSLLGVPQGRFLWLPRAGEFAWWQQLFAELPRVQRVCGCIVLMGPSHCKQISTARQMRT